METDDTLARLTFNALATRAFFTDRTNGVRLRIEAGVVAFRPVIARRGVDILTIERRTRGVVADVPRDALTRRLMTRLFKAGLSDDQPYFTLQPSTPRGWFSLDHHPAEQPPQRLPLMVVTEFDPPPIAIDMGLWRRLQRALAGPKPVSPTLWQDFMTMFHSAVRMTERSTRGRKSSERIQAEKLLVTIERSVGDFQTLAINQPELAEDVASLLFSVTGESTVDDTDNSVIEFPAGRSKHDRPPEIDRQFVEQVLADTAEAEPPAEKPKRRARRKWPDATEEEIRSEAKLLESEPNPKPESAVEPEATEPEPKSTDPEPEHDVLDAETQKVADPDVIDVHVEFGDPLDVPIVPPPLAAEAFEPEADPEPESKAELESEEFEPGPQPESEDASELADLDPQPESIEPIGYLDTELESETEAEAEPTPEPEHSDEPPHEGEADFDLADVMPARPQPDRDESNVVNDDEDEDKPHGR